MITNLTKLHKKHLDLQNIELTEEITNMRKFNVTLTKDLNETTHLLQKSEADKNSLKMLKISVTEQLQKSVQYHEEEVNNRLRFESKLNNTCGVFRELETRFLVVSKEYEINLIRINQLYIDSKNLRNSNKQLGEQNVLLQSRNFKLKEKQKSVDENTL